MRRPLFVIVLSAVLSNCTGSARESAARAADQVVELVCSVYPLARRAVAPPSSLDGGTEGAP